MAASDTAIMERHKPLNYKADIDTSMHKRSYKLELKKEVCGIATYFWEFYFWGKKIKESLAWG